MKPNSTRLLMQLILQIALAKKSSATTTLIITAVTPPPSPTLTRPSSPTSQIVPPNNNEDHARELLADVKSTDLNGIIRWMKKNLNLTAEQMHLSPLRTIYTKKEIINFLSTDKNVVDALKNAKLNDDIYKIVIDALSMIGDGEINEMAKMRGKLFGDPLSNLNIEAMMEPYTDQRVPYVGTFAVNTIANINKKPSFAFISNIIPIRKQNNNVGHWIAVYIDKDVEYYDPLGHPPDKKMRRALTQMLGPHDKMQFKINMIQDQATNSMNCGWFAMNFLIKRYGGESFIQATNFANNNEKKIKSMQKYYKKFSYL